ncbi:MAG: hypothetical protein H6Q68_2625 [Firmicutes bacterium]|nr:hypothetical protein [Bacillota bacterium]
MKWLRLGLLPMIMAVVLHSTVQAATVQPAINLKGLKLPEWAATISPYGGKLLLSDSPETVPADGIMYQDIVNGDTRLFFHHVNGTSEGKKIVVLLENSADKPVHITVYQYGLGGPGLDYLKVGKKVQLDYVKGDDVYLLEASGKESVSLIPSLDHSIVEPNMLVNGMYDFKTDGPVNVKVMMMPVDADIREFAAQAKVLPPDVAEYRLRGTFEGKDRLVVPGQTYDTKEHGTVAVTLADNKLDPYVTGIDATDGTRTTNYGNYGIVYKIFVPSTADGKMSYYLNPRGGEYAGWLGVNYRHQENYTIATPADKMSFGHKNSNESSYIGTYEGGKSLWLTFSPPGASNLPVKLIIAPGK